VFLCLHHQPPLLHLPQRAVERAWGQTPASLGAPPDLLHDGVRVVLAPHSFDLVVGSNLFWDLLSEITAAVAGTIGIAPWANLNPEGPYAHLFEPINGSALDIAGDGTAIPSGAIWAGAMMLEHAGFPEAGARILAALKVTLASGTKPSDLGAQPPQTRWPTLSRRALSRRGLESTPDRTPPLDEAI
jgi:hypothetical protein